MADIYIVYAREDEAIAEKLYSCLSGQWNVWWDDEIVGDVGEVIESEVPKAGCILPIISSASRGKPPVIDEMILGRKYKKPIIPIKIDDSEAPYGFGTLRCIEMKSWCGEEDHPGFVKLKRRLLKIVSQRESPKRPGFIANNRLRLPTLFLSVSSYNTQLEPADAMRMLRMFKVPAVLVSAYDLIEKHDSDKRYDPSDLIKQLVNYKKEGGFILIDSGNYEKNRLGDKSWKVKNLKDALAKVPHDWAFCYDNLEPSKSKKKLINELIKTVLQNQKFTNGAMLPIVHAPKLAKGGYQLKYVPAIIREISEELGSPLIAIPERELGGGLIARARMIKSIRQELNKLPYYQAIHVLGTGNPWTIAVLAAAGADTFDGLEWCRYVIDKESEVINHFHLFDLYSILDDSEIGYSAKTIFENLKYYTAFRSLMWEYYSQGNIEAHVQGVLGKKAFNILKVQYPELFE